LTYARCCQVVTMSEYMLFHSWVRSYSSRIFGNFALSVCDIFSFKQKFWLRRRHLTLSIWGRVLFRRKIWLRRRDLTLWFGVQSHSSRISGNVFVLYLKVSKCPFPSAIYLPVFTELLYDRLLQSSY